MMDQYDLEQLQLDAQMFDANHGVSVGTEDSFYSTDDGWETWEHRTVDYNDSWISVGFAVPLVGWMGGFYGTLVKTTNGGATWVEQTLPGVTTDDRIEAIEAVSGSEVRVLVSGIDRVLVYESFDGGATWEVSDPGLRHPDFSATYADDFFVADDGGIWAAGYLGLILAREGVATAADENLARFPVRPVLHGASPNPFNPATEISFTLPAESHVRLEIFDLRGRAVAQLVDGALAAGPHTVRWDGRDASGRALGSGVFLARLRWAGGQDATKLLLVK
jgi:hypothetical protein